MSTKRDERRPGRPWIIDIPYKDARTGRRRRYYKNARLQTADGARREERLLLTILAEKGYLPDRPDIEPQVEQATPQEISFKEAITLFEETLKPRLKLSTQRSYGKIIDTYLEARFGDLPLSQIDKAMLVRFDLELATTGLSMSTRNNIQIPLRTIINNAVELGRHDRSPEFPRLNRVRSKVYEPPSPGEIDRLLKEASEPVRAAVALAAFAGLRAGEVRGSAGLTSTSRATLWSSGKPSARGRWTPPSRGTSGSSRSLPGCSASSCRRTRTGRRPPPP